MRTWIRSPFFFLFTETRREEIVAQYLLREHRRGRPLGEILEDRYIKNRLSDAEAKRLLDRPEVVRALGQDDLEAVRAERQLLEQAWMLFR